MEVKIVLFLHYKNCSMVYSFIGPSNNIFLISFFLVAVSGKRKMECIYLKHELKLSLGDQTI